MTIKLAVNYSDATADLLRRGHVDFDYFKTPAWPDLIATAQALRPVNVHFPLLVGYGIDGARTARPGSRRTGARSRRSWRKRVPRWSTSTWSRR